MFHIPVMVTHVCKILIWDRNGIYIDGTLGGGGHAKAILEHLDVDGKVIGIDQDDDALENANRYLKNVGARFISKKGNFQDIDKIAHQSDFASVHGIFLDLGVSSYQIDTPERGLSYRFDGPLDMRMSASNPVSAKEIINTCEEQELARIFKEYGEEKLARKVARQIVRERKKKLFESTFELRDAVVAVVPRQFQVKSLSRIFLALRIAVNEEFSALKQALAASLTILKPEGRLVVLTYHSLEDRIVKQFFKQEQENCICPPAFPECVCGKTKRLDIITKKSIQPDNAEILANPRARSARLRAARRCAD
ncbi:16S rRNA (cytosine(1402)-N(4))-methyltransferase RsmH [candidate division KSB1 bacterium]|nr:16S rRNA (cytosine(1402)-N(4))-methyltransferase RsmH [candidate division KSB1 bacterium]